MKKPLSYLFIIFGFILILIICWNVFISSVPPDAGRGGCFDGYRWYDQFTATTSDPIEWDKECRQFIQNQNKIKDDREISSDQELKIWCDAQDLKNISRSNYEDCFANDRDLKGLLNSQK